jgi:hypothetical protein
VIEKAAGDSTVDCETIGEDTKHIRYPERDVCSEAKRAYVGKAHEMINHLSEPRRGVAVSQDLSSGSEKVCFSSLI